MRNKCYNVNGHFTDLDELYERPPWVETVFPSYTVGSFSLVCGTKSYLLNERFLWVSTKTTLVLNQRLRFIVGSEPSPESFQ